MGGVSAEATDEARARRDVLKAARLGDGTIAESEKTGGGGLLQTVPHGARKGAWGVKGASAGFESDSSALFSVPGR